jgi:hypothetical protein
MPKKFKLKCLSVVLLLCVSACTDDFEIRVDESGRLLTFHDGQILNNRPFAPCLSDIIVYDNSQPPSVVWQLRARHGCTKVESVVVGEASAGFIEIVSFDPTPGMRVYAEAREAASGQPGRWGRSDPWRLGKSGTVTD